MEALLRRTSSNETAWAGSSSERCPGTERWGAWPSPVGLTLGILAAVAAQVVLISYHYVRLRWCATRRVQTPPRPYEFSEGIVSHLGNPGGIIMMVVYLCASWMFDIMPCSYYHFDGGVRSAIVNATTLALLDAGIALEDLVCACSAGSVQGALLLDLSAQEDNVGSELSVGLLPRTERISFVQLESKVPLSAMQETLNFALEGCRHVFAFMSRQVELRSQEILASRGVINN